MLSTERCEGCYDLGMRSLEDMLLGDLRSDIRMSLEVLIAGICLAFGQASTHLENKFVSVRSSLLIKSSKQCK